MSFDLNDPNESIRVLIVDDHRLFREGLAALLSVTDNLLVVGEAQNGLEAVELAQKLEPDVVIMDIQMPIMGGLEATRRILAHSQHVRILVVSMFEDDDNVFSAMQAGARGYILKGAAPEELLRAIQAVARGEALFAPSIANRLIRYFNRAPQLPANLLPELSARERELLALIAQGKTNPQMASSLEISEKTVRNHITSIFSKLQVTSRAEAILKAKEVGL